MLRRLRIRITLLTALLTGGVLVCTLLFAFTVTRRQYLTTAVQHLRRQWPSCNTSGIATTGWKATGWHSWRRRPA